MLRGLAVPGDLDELIAGSHEILDRAIEFVETDKGLHKVVAVVILFSGGNASTTLAHPFKDRATHAAHANTGIGIERTRQFVRGTCKSWGLPLIEEHSEPGQGYRELVLGEVKNRNGSNVCRGGFPGPGAHNLMYQRLKERALHKVRRQLVTNGRKERVVFLAGRRREESSGGRRVSPGRMR